MKDPSPLLEDSVVYFPTHTLSSTGSYRYTVVAEANFAENRVRGLFQT